MDSGGALGYRWSMALQQVRDLLARTIEYHRKAAGYYAGMGAHADKEAVRLVTEYLAGHELVLVRILEDFLTRGEHEVCRTWIQNDPDYHMERILDGLSIDEAVDAKEIIETAVELNRRLIEYFRRMKEISPNERVEELFWSLEAHELDEQKRLSAMYCEL
jgi:hypothetical protein